MGEWTNGLFGFVNDIGTFIRTCCCPCVTAGKNAEAMEENCCLYGFLSTCACATLFSRAHIRGKIRGKYDIQVSYLIYDLFYLAFYLHFSLLLLF